MDYIKQFYKELQENGKTPNDLAKEIQDCLNSAIIQKENECKERQKFEKDAESVAEVFNSFIETYYPNMIGTKYNADMIIQTCELAKGIKKGKFTEDIDNLINYLFK